MSTAREVSDSRLRAFCGQIIKYKQYTKMMIIRQIKTKIEKKTINLSSNSMTPNGSLFITYCKEFIH